MAISQEQAAFIRNIQALASHAEQLATDGNQFVVEVAEVNGVVVRPAGRWYVAGYQPAVEDLPSSDPVFEFNATALTNAVVALQNIVTAINANMNALREVQ